MDTILVTGGAGFIGYHLSKRLLKDGYNVVGYDNMNDYYDPKLKEDRVRDLEESGQDYRFIKGDLADKDMVFHLFEEIKPAIVVNLAAQAGVRYSIDHPDSYIQSNIVGFFNILEACRHYPVKHLLFASSSSIYGNQEKVPFSVNDPTDRPISLYAATKKSDELMAYTYSHLYRIPATGLRFFTVYGPWGRPDMALFKFTEAMLKGRPIDIYNQGQMARDFGPAWVESDKAARAVLFRGDMYREWLAYGSDSKRVAEAFVAGVNAFVAQTEADASLLPEEFKLLGYKPAQWAAEDTVRIRHHGLTLNFTGEVDRAQAFCDGKQNGARVDWLRRELVPDVKVQVPEGLDTCGLPAKELKRRARRGDELAALKTDGASIEVVGAESLQMHVEAIESLRGAGYVLKPAL